MEGRLGLSELSIVSCGFVKQGSTHVQLDLLPMPCALSSRDQNDDLP